MWEASSSESSWSICSRLFSSYLLPEKNTLNFGGCLERLHASQRSSKRMGIATLEKSGLLVRAVMKAGVQAEDLNVEPARPLNSSSSFCLETIYTSSSRWKAERSLS